MDNQKDIYKQSVSIDSMVKKGVGVTLDVDVVEAIKELQNTSRGAKFSPLVNSLVREHPEIKKRLKKNGK